MAMLISRCNVGAALLFSLVLAASLTSTTSSSILISADSEIGFANTSTTTDSHNSTTTPSTTTTPEKKKSETLAIANQVIGWIYFVAWSVSFYPQVISNYKRKSVVGLNLDYLTYNITGFLGYAIFNVALFWVPSIRDEYMKTHHTTNSPVQANDVFFAVHAVLLTIITIGQCLIYDRGGQKVSWFCRILMGGSWIFVIVAIVLVFTGKVSWLFWVSSFSYIKMGVTLIKYVPQAYMNYSRKSTVGLAIGNWLLDFTGGFFSTLQMVLQYYNTGDATIFTGDPTKLALGFFSMFFDCIFFVQHYCLYTKRTVDDIDKPDEAAQHLLSPTN